MVGDWGGVGFDFLVELCQKEHHKSTDCTNVLTTQVSPTPNTLKPHVEIISLIQVRGRGCCRRFLKNFLLQERKRRRYEEFVVKETSCKKFVVKKVLVLL